MSAFPAAMDAAAQVLGLAVFVGLLAGYATAWTVLSLDARRKARAERRTGRRRADGPAVKGFRRLDALRDNLRDDAARLAHWASTRSERAGAEYTERVLRDRIRQEATR